jgi:Icc-related predicted phosphoesterase
MQRLIRGLRPLIWFQGGVDIVIAHAPPRNVNDGEDRCHKGFECFRWLIDKYEPDYFIHGHIHANFRDASERITVVNTTEVINSYGYFLFEV